DPEHDLLKSGVYVDANTDSTVNVGDHIQYTFTVTNTGNVTVSGIVINDGVIGVTNLALVPATLAPGETGTVTYNYPVTQSDINNGGVYNIATAEGDDPTVDPVEDESEDPNPLDPGDPNYDPTCEDCTFTELSQDPELERRKSGVSGDGNSDVTAYERDHIQYTFTVTNTGNVTVSGIVINDGVIGRSEERRVGKEWRSGGTATDSYNYPVTQSDINKGGA